MTHLPGREVSGLGQMMIHLPIKVLKNMVSSRTTLHALKIEKKTFSMTYYCISRVIIKDVYMNKYEENQEIYNLGQ